MNVRRAAILVALGVSVCAGVTVIADSQQRPIFRANTESVSVNVSVKVGNKPVLALTPHDFLVTDNGVAQQVTSVTTEAVPIDVTLFQDTSLSQAGRINALKADILRIAAMLRPIDRVRLLTIDDQVQDVFGWKDAGHPLNLDSIKPSQHSSVFDPIFLALMHRPDLDRRHLIVAMTDGIDAGSVIAPHALTEIAKRAESVLHLIAYSEAPVMTPGVYPWKATRVGAAGVGPLHQAVRLTGGEVHDPIFRVNVVEFFKRIFDEFRQSYVLRYTPTSVAPEGWHELGVLVNGYQRAKIRARKGYYGS